jgi:hypothetical protein
MTEWLAEAMGRVTARVERPVVANGHLWGRSDGVTPPLEERGRYRDHMQTNVPGSWHNSRYWHSMTGEFAPIA